MEDEQGEYGHENEHEHGHDNEHEHEHDYEAIADSLDTQFGQVKEALGYFLNAEFNRAYACIQAKAELGYPYHNLGKSFLFFIKAMFTFDPEDIQKTMRQMELSIATASKMIERQRTSIYAAVTKAIGLRARTSAPSESALRLTSHCELIVAELTLLKAVLLISSDSQEGWMLMLRQGLHVHNSHSYYAHAAASPFISDTNFRSGVLLGNGIFNLLFPLLPPAVARGLAFFGYKGDTALGLQQLNESASLEDTVRAPLSVLVILIYHLVVASTITSTDRAQGPRQDSSSDWYQSCDALLKKHSRLYPNSPIYKYLWGRFLFVRRDLVAAISLFEDTMQMDIEWPQLKHAGYWEVCLCSLYTLDWHRGFTYAKVMAEENKWSKAFYTYLQAVFLWSMDPSRLEEVKELLRQVPGKMKRVAGKSIPIEKFALHRAEMVLHKGRMPFHPALEIALVWDGLPMISQADRAKIEALMLESMASVEDSEMQAGILLTLATLKRLQADLDAAVGYVEQALRLKVPSDSYCFPLSQLELCQVFLLAGDLGLAEKHYAESVGYRHQYLVKKFVELRQARVKIELGLAKQRKHGKVDTTAR